MLRKTVSVVMLSVLITGALALAANIQSAEANGTIYIRADGSVDPPDASISTVDNVTYTLTGNITSDADGIVVGKDSIVVDGAGYTLTGSGSGIGVALVERSNVTVRNMTIEAFADGFVLDSSFDNTLSGNKVTANNWYGILLGYSSSNTLSNNVMVGNRYSFGVYGYFLSNFLHSVDASNLVDGKPIYYFVNQSDMVVNADAYPMVGYLGFVNCVNVTVRGLNLTGTGQGLLLAFSNDSRITDNNVANNLDGIRLFSSSNNVLSGNNVTANKGNGIMLSSSSNSTLFGNNVTANNNEGIVLGVSSSNNVLSGNNVADNWVGTDLYDSPGNVLSDNNLANNGYGIKLYNSSGNTLFGNNVTANDGYGVGLNSSSNNKIYHNNFVNNTLQVYSYGSINAWDDGFPSGGNFWGDYNGTEPDLDGIGDTPYIIDANNTDRYPLTAPLRIFEFVYPVGSTGPINVDLMTNSTVKNVQIDEMARTLSFNVGGATGTLGFCRISIPNIIVESLWNGTYTVFINGEPWPFTKQSDDQNTYIYINYTHSEHDVTIIGEFPSPLTITALMIATLLAVIIYKKKRNARAAGTFIRWSH